MFQIQPYSPVPVYEQIVSQTERLVLSGVLKAGDQMPSVRSLSIRLSVNPNTIQKAYNELDARGVLCAVPGKGCFVAVNAGERLTELCRGKLTELRSLADVLALAGIPKEELIQCIESAYEKR
ncbi:MAG: GntR family transcriptional regulator [Clostridia bacterium]|nr:GntR family transcriptional regulator [Clostridia bacterium]